MVSVTDKVKKKVTKAKDKVVGTTGKATDTTMEKVSSSSYGRAKDPTREYDEKEPMSPAKIKQHEPTAVRREMTEHLVDAGKEVPNPEAAKERARRSGMAKGTAGSPETGSEY